MLQPSIEVIILHHNGRENIDNCLKSVIKTDYSNFTITVVDNNSTDDSAKFLKKNFQSIKLIENKVNLGYAGGNNIALKQTNANYAVLLNDDTIVMPKWLKEMLNIMESDTKIATCQPKVLSLRNKEMFDNCAAGCFLDIYGYPIYRGRVFDTIEEDKGQYDNVVEIFLSVGVCMMIRVSCLKESGFLDEDFHIYFEEFDLCWRLRLLGYTNVSVPSAVIYHIGAVTYKKRSYRWSYLNHRNSIIVIIKNYSFINLIKRLPVRVFFEFISCISFFLSLDFERGTANLMAILWILFHPLKLINKRKDVQRLRRINDDSVNRLMITKSVVIQYYIYKRKYFKDYLEYIQPT